MASVTPRQARQRWIDECVQEMAWQPGDASAMAAWQTKLRSAVAVAMGIGRFTVPDDLHAEYGDPVACEGYVRQSVRFESRPDCVVFGYLLFPERTDAPLPTVLCFPGHGIGVDAIVGLAEEPYHRDFALQCVRHGYGVLAIEQIGFGRRRSDDDFASCDTDNKAAIMLGESMTGWRVWDAMRAIDLLMSHPFVDAERLVTMGISGGGLTSLWTAAMDERICAAVVSGYFNTFRDSVLAVRHCVDNFVPGVLRLCEMPDFAGLVAPRALFVESGTEDDLFPIAAFQQAVARARSIYRAFGIPERFDAEEFAGDHRFHGIGAFAFLDKALNPESRSGRSHT